MRETPMCMTRIIPGRNGPGGRINLWVRTLHINSARTPDSRALDWQQDADEGLLLEQHIHSGDLVVGIGSKRDYVIAQHSHCVGHGSTPEEG
jgi:hypothetical protein